MDPSINLSIKKSSFDKTDLSISRNIFKNESIQFKIETKSVQKEEYIINPKNIDYNLQRDLQRDLSLSLGLNLGLNLGKSIFKFYSSVIMANLDALSFATKHYNGSLKFSANTSDLNHDQYFTVNTPNLLKVCIINDSTTGILDYIRFRKPESVIFGINSHPDKNMFSINESPDMSLKQNYKKFISQIQESQILGLDLMVSMSNTDYLYILNIAVFILHNDGIFICKLDNIDIQFLYLCSLFFETIEIYRLLSSSCIQNNNDIYLIAKNKKYRLQSHSKTEKLIDKLEYYIQTNVWDIQIPTEFKEWIQKTVNDINNFKMDKELDIFLPFIIWNIPDKN